MHCLCQKKKYTESRKKKRWYLNAVQSKPDKRVFYQRLSAAQQHPEQPEKHKGETSFGYQQTLSNSKIRTGCCDSELFTMQLTT